MRPPPPRSGRVGARGGYRRDGDGRDACLATTEGAFAGHEGTIGRVMTRSIVPSPSRLVLAALLAASVLAACSGHAKPPATTSTTVGVRRALTVKTYEYSYDVGQLTSLRVAAGRVPV